MERKNVSHALSTWNKVKEFQDGIEELGKKIDLSIARLYLLTGKKMPEVSAKIYQEIDRLQRIRVEGIQGEMDYCLAQARYNNLVLSEDIQTGKDIRPFFSEKLLEKVPSLDLYTHFMWYSGEELEKMKKKAEEKDESLVENTHNNTELTGDGR